MKSLRFFTLSSPFARFPRLSPLEHDRASSVAAEGQLCARLRHNLIPTSSVAHLIIMIISTARVLVHDILGPVHLVVSYLTLRLLCFE